MKERELSKINTDIKKQIIRMLVRGKERREKTVDFISIGAPRCGITWLANCLRAHPDLCLSEPKEIKYPEMSSKTRIYLNKVLRNDIEILENIMQRELLCWKMKHVNTAEN